MAHFVKWRGPLLAEGAPRISKTIQSTEVGGAFKFGIWGGSTLNVGPNDVSVAQCNRRAAVEGSSNNITWYELVGLRAGHVMIEARNPADSGVWDSFQLAVKAKAAKKGGRGPVQGIGYDYQVTTHNIGPNWNAEIVLTLKVALIPVNGAGTPLQINDTNGTPYSTKAWTNGEWSHWVSRFKSLIEKNWSAKFWLATPASLTELEVKDGATAKRRVNLHCILKLHVNAATKAGIASAHHRVPVVQAMNAVGTGAPNSTGVSFRSNSTLLDHQDLLTDVGMWSSATKPFNTATHEIGHLLGLRHPFEGHPQAGAAGNSVYCVVGNPDCNSVLGLGDELRASYAAPWQTAAASWFNSAGKGHRLKASDFTPSTVRIAPAPA